MTAPLAADGASVGAFLPAPPAASGPAAHPTPPAPAPLAKPLPHPRDVYLASRPIDVLAAGGASILVFLLVKLLVLRGVLSGERTTTVTTLSYYFAFIVNYPHFAATNLRLYQSLDRMMQFPKTAFLTPVLALGACIVALANPQTVAPWWAKFFLVWSGYHFCGQTKGICLLYARRLGVAIDARLRGLIVAISFLPWLHLILAADTGPNWGPYFDITVPSGLPFLYKQLPPVFRDVSTVCLWVAPGLFAALGVLTFLRQGILFPLAAATPLVAQWLWFGVGQSTATFSEFVPFFHSLQYLMIAWVFQLKEESAEPGAEIGADFVLTKTIVWGAIIAFLGAFLFQVMPAALAWKGYPRGLAEPVFIAGVQVHHFFVDGVIWKVRDPRTRAMLGGNLFDLAGVARG